jgi:hypothetical protein
MDQPRSRYFAINTDASGLVDRKTGCVRMVGQGFGVCDRVADALNAGGPAMGEIGELVDSIKGADHGR